MDNDPILSAFTGLASGLLQAMEAPLLAPGARDVELVEAAKGARHPAAALLPMEIMASPLSGIEQFCLLERGFSPGALVIGGPG